jgi:LPXTG-motif cell wall-anchored protein
MSETGVSIGETPLREYARHHHQTTVLAAMAAVLVGGTIIGLIWADTSDVAGSIAVITNIIGVVGIVLLLIALAVVTRRRRQKLAA